MIRLDLIEQIRNAGIIGAGGAGFPTHAKLTSPAEYALLNAAECEPLLRVDQQLLVLYTDMILKGFEAAARQVGAAQAIIGIKQKHGDAIDVLRQRIQALGKGDYITIHELADFYPAGDEQILVYELTGRIVPEGGIPIKVGCVVMNVETALNVGRAMDDLPVTDTFLTVAGDVPKPLTMLVPVGTPLVEVLAQAGLSDTEGYAVIDGGPMMGKVLPNLAVTVTKKSKGYVVLRKDHPLILKKTASDQQVLMEGRTACEQCRMCTDMCPRYLIGHNLHPHLIMRAIKYNLARIEELTQASLCCQCGVCTLFACPAHLKPHQVNFMFKQQLGANKIRYTPKTTEYHANPARSYRRLPVKRLILHLGIASFDGPAPMTEVSFATETVRISLRQHVGAPSQPVVAVGDAVVKGQLIGAIPEGALGAAVHSSVNGTVQEITNDFISIKVG